MHEEFRIKKDFGTVSGFTGIWLVQHRFGPNDEWTIVYFADTEKDAHAYIDNMPDWVNEV